MTVQNSIVPALDSNLRPALIGPPSDVAADPNLSSLLFSWDTRDSSILESGTNGTAKNLWRRSDWMAKCGYPSLVPQASNGSMTEFAHSSPVTPGWNTATLLSPDNSSAFFRFTEYGLPTFVDKVVSVYVEGAPGSSLDMGANVYDADALAYLGLQSWSVTDGSVARHSYLIDSANEAGYIHLYLYPDEDVYVSGIQIEEASSMTDYESCWDRATKSVAGIIGTHGGSEFLWYPDGWNFNQRTTPLLISDKFASGIPAISSRGDYACGLVVRTAEDESFYSPNLTTDGYTLIILARRDTGGSTGTNLGACRATGAGPYSFNPALGGTLHYFTDGIKYSYPSELDDETYLIIMTAQEGVGVNRYESDDVSTPAETDIATGTFTDHAGGWISAFYHTAQKDPYTFLGGMRLYDGVLDEAGLQWCVDHFQEYLDG